MSDFFMLRALLFAGECFLASVALPLLGFAVTLLLRRRAALCHLVWTTMFGVLAVLPVIALLLPPRQIVEHAAAPAMDALPITATVMAAPPPSLTLSLSDLFTLENGVILLVALWLAGLCWQAVRLGLGAFGLMRLRRYSVPFATEIETGCAVRLSGGEHGPSTFGILRPLILLPRSAPDWPVTRLDAVLRHEAAHVARHDTASQLLARLVCAAFWLNPLLWLAARQARRAAEIAADDAVVAGGMMPSVYATELVRLAAQSHGPVPGIAMATPPLTARVQSILETTTTRTGVSRMDIAKTVSFGVAATLLLGVARFDIAVAQDAPAPNVERNVDVNVEKAVDAKAKAEADPVKRKQYRKDAARMAANADKAKAEAETARMKVLSERVGDPALSGDERVAATRELTAWALARSQEAHAAQNERIAATQSLAEGALARTQEALARQAKAQAGDKADPGKQQLMQLMADSVAVARQEMAKARVRASADMQRTREGIALNFPGTEPVGAGSRYVNRDGGVQVDAQVDAIPLGDAEKRRDVMDPLNAAITTAVAEARKKITAAIDEARAKAGLPPTPRSSVGFQITNPGDLHVPPAPGAPN